MNNSKVIESYNKMGEKFDLARSKDLRMEKAYLAKLTELLPAGAAILDLGCGSGRPIAEYFLSRGFRVKGIDASQKMIELATQYFPQMQPELQDMRDLKLKERFNAVIMWHSFFHLSADDQRDVLKNLKQHLHSPGFVLFTTGPAAGEAWGENYGEMLYHASLSLDEYREILASQNFEVVVLDIENPAAGGATVWLARSRSS